MTIEEMNQVFAELEQLGHVEKSGQYREGHPVWVITDLGRRFSILERGSLRQKPRIPGEDDTEATTA